MTSSKLSIDTRKYTYLMLAILATSCSIMHVCSFSYTPATRMGMASLSLTTSRSSLSTLTSTSLHVSSQGQEQRQGKRRVVTDRRVGYIQDANVKSVADEGEGENEDTTRSAIAAPSQTLTSIDSSEIKLDGIDNNAIMPDSETSQLQQEQQQQQNQQYQWEDDDVRVKAIRSTLQTAESFRQWKVNNGLVPKIDPITGKVIRDDSQFILAISAAVIAIGLYAIRIGGRVALISAIGLDFASDNPQYKEYIDQIIALSDSLGSGAEVALFLSAWIVSKVFIFDVGAIVLALSSGILFHGVLQGALLSALGSTLGSSVAYALAKFDTPLRKGALSILEKYPALRGIDNVVAEDGLKAILTLRLAPILPIPIGAYNYIYGVSKVPYYDFAGGIFLGSLKPYLLDSFLGYFAFQLVEGTVDRSGYEDLILVISLLASVFIGIFASQLAGESWNSVKREIEADKRRNKQLEIEQKGYRVVTSVLGVKLPKEQIDRQIASKKAAIMTENVIESEFRGTTTLKETDVIQQMNLLEYIALQPALLSAFLKYSDPTIVASEGGLYATNSAKRTASSDSASGPTPDSDQFDSKLLNFEVAVSVAKNLWYLPVLSLLSGLTPAARIVAESHVSRMPDTPIAHDIDTFLLWPAIGNPQDRGLPPTVFQTPAAAITDKMQYNVDWEAVKEVYVYYLTNSLLVSGLLALSLYSYLILSRPESEAEPEVE